MTGKDELGARFDEHKPDTEERDNSENMNNTTNTTNTSNTGNMSGASDTENTPGPDKDPDSTRNRQQVPMYLSDERADALNGLYERLDGRSKIAEQGGIEKHADFMAEIADLAIEHEEELADRLGIEDG